MIQISIFLALILAAGATQATQPLKPVHVCMLPYREEMATAAIKTGQRKKFFRDAGISLNIDYGKPMQSQTRRRVAFALSNFNWGMAQYYFVGTMGEAILLQGAARNGCDIVSTTFEGVVGSKIDISKYRPVATYLYGKDYDTSLVVRNGSGIKSVRDLKGKSIRLSEVGSTLAFIHMLKVAGLSPSDLHIKSFPLAKIPWALDHKKLDAVLSYNPTIPLLLGSGRAHVLKPDIFTNYYKGYVPHSVVLVSHQFVLEHKEAYLSFMKAFRRAALEISHHPINVIDSVPDIQKLYTDAEVEKSLNFLNIRMPLLATEMTPKAFFEKGRFKQYAALLKDKGFIHQAVDLDSWSR